MQDCQLVCCTEGRLTGSNTLPSRRRSERLARTKTSTINEQRQAAKAEATRKRDERQHASPRTSLAYRTACTKPRDGRLHSTPYPMHTPEKLVEKPYRSKRKGTNPHGQDGHVDPLQARHRPRSYRWLRYAACALPPAPAPPYQKRQSHTAVAHSHKPSNIIKTYPL